MTLIIMNQHMMKSLINKTKYYVNHITIILSMALALATLTVAFAYADSDYTPLGQPYTINGYLMPWSEPSITQVFNKPGYYRVDFTVTGDVVNDYDNQLVSNGTSPVICESGSYSNCSMGYNVTFDGKGPGYFVIHIDEPSDVSNTFLFYYSSSLTSGKTVTYCGTDGWSTPEPSKYVAVTVPRGYAFYVPSGVEYNAYYVPSIPVEADYYTVGPQYIVHSNAGAMNPTYENSIKYNLYNVYNMVSRNLRLDGIVSTGDYVVNPIQNKYTNRHQTVAEGDLFYVHVPESELSNCKLYALNNSNVDTTYSEGNVYIPSTTTESGIEWTTSGSGITTTSPPSGGADSQYIGTDGNAYTSFVDSLIESLSALFNRGVYAAKNLYNSGSEFFAAIGEMFSWLPAPVQSVATSALTIIFVIGIIKVFL